MSKYMKTWKNTSENYKKQLPCFEKFTEPKISYIIPWDFIPHFVRHISCEAKLFLFNLRQNLDFGNFSGLLENKYPLLKNLQSSN